MKGDIGRMLFLTKTKIMGRSQNSFIKQQKEKKKQMKKKDKEERKKERQENNLKGGDLSDMIAYLDENGNIVDEKPEEIKPVVKKPEPRRVDPK